jgi:indole-3-glycerol phosphate synthase
MTDFLSIILEHRRRDVAEAMTRTSLDALQRLADQAWGGRRSLSLALNKAGPVGVIAEIKRASPSKGDLAPDLDPATTAQVYEAGGAAALSVLTEPRYFKGSDADLKAARAAVRLPVLRKDFLFCDYQIIESAALGADAVLLIARILPDDDLARLHALSLKLGLDALVEAVTADEVERACRIGARLIGINTRDLQTFAMDPDRASRLAPPPCATCAA